MRMNEYRNRSAGHYARVKELSLAGLSPDEIARQIGMSTSNVVAMRTVLADRGEIEPAVKLTPEQEKQAVDLFRKGCKTRDIVDACGLDPRFSMYIKKILQARIKMDTIEGLAKAGKSTSQIADALHISISSATSLRRRLVNMGALKSLREPLYLTEKVAGLYNDGKSQQEIAVKMGIEASNVRKLVYEGRSRDLVPELRCWECNHGGHDSSFCRSGTKKAFDMAVSGSTIKAISEATGLSMDGLASIFSRARKSGRLPADLFPPRGTTGSGTNNATSSGKRGRPSKGDYAGLFSQGKSIEAVAEETGCDVMTVAKRWKRWKQAQAA